MNLLRATVTQASPLRVRVDGATVDSPADYASGVRVVGARVWVESVGSTLVVVGGGADSGWRVVGGPGEPVFQNGWGNFGQGYSTVAFRRLPTGLVVVRGLAAGGAANSAIFTLPAGYRPLAGLLFPTSAAAANARVDVDASGAVRHVAGGISDFGLDVIRFLAEQ